MNIQLWIQIYKRLKFLFNLFSPINKISLKVNLISNTWIKQHSGSVYIYVYKIKTVLFCYPYRFKFAHVNKGSILNIDVLRGVKQSFDKKEGYYKATFYTIPTSLKY